MYPPHSIALGSIYLSSLLLSFEQPSPPTREGETGPAELASLLNQHLNWETKFKTKAEDLDGAESLTNVHSHILNGYFPDIAHTFLDLLITYTQSSASANTSPSTPSSPSPHLSRQSHPPQSHLSQQQQQQHLSLYQYNADQLIRLKIFMRQTEHKPRPRTPPSGSNTDSAGNKSGTTSVIEGIGQNEGTTIFSFFPPGS
jgi:CTD kinase subunit beta